MSLTSLTSLMSPVAVAGCGVFHRALEQGADDERRQIGMFQLKILVRRSASSVKRACFFVSKKLVITHKSELSLRGAFFATKSLDPVPTRLAPRPGT